MSTEAAEGFLTIDTLVCAVKEHWLLAVSVAFVITIAVTAYAFSLTPIYRSEVLVTAADDDSRAGLSQLVGGLGGVAALAGVDLGSRSNVEVSIAMLNSSRFTESFIDEKKLMPELFWKEWDARNGRWIDPESAPTMFEAIRTFDTQVRSFSRDRRTGLIKVGIEWRDREKAAAWANELIARVNETARREAIEDARRSIDYLNKELTKTSVVELQQAVYRLIETQINRIMIANVRDEYAFKVIDPAVVPDAKFKVRPKRLYYMVLGAFIGGIVGFGVAVWRTYRSMRSSSGDAVGAAK